MTNYRTWYDPPSRGDEEPFPGSPDDMMNTVAALRAQNAELQAALKEARPFVEAETDEDLYEDLGGQHAAEWKERGKAAYIALAAIDAALAAAGHTQGSGE